MKKKFLTATQVLKLWMNLPRSEQYSTNAKRFAKMAGLKSILEVRTQAWLEEKGIPFKYEYEKWKYQYKEATYTPDFIVDGMPFVIECKGKLTKEVRKKMVAILECNPDRMLYMVFERPENKINRGSQTTYGQWADKLGIVWSKVTPDPLWFKKGKKRGAKR